MKKNAFMLVLTGLLLLVAGIQPVQADKQPRFFVIGEGNMEAFNFENGTCVITNVPYTDENFRNKNDVTLELGREKDSPGSFILKKGALKAEARIISAEMIAHGSQKTRNDFRDNNFGDRKLKTIRWNGRKKILSKYREKLSPDHEKYILNPTNAAYFSELWVYDAQNDEVVVSNLNGEGRAFEGQDFDYFVYWFCDIVWSRDGKKIGYSSNKTNTKHGTSIWLLDENGHDRLILDAREHGSCVFLGWIDDNRFIFGRRHSLFVGDLSGKYALLAANVMGRALSPDGRYYVVKRLNSEGNWYGLAIVDIKAKKVADVPVELKNYQDDNLNFVWSPDSKRFAYYAFSRKDDDPKKFYTTATKLGIVEVLPNLTFRHHFVDTPCPGSSFLLGSSLSWFGNDVVIANLANGTCVGLEVR